MAEKINETESWFFEIVKKVDKTIAKVISRQKTEINKNKTKMGNIIIETTKIQKVNYSIFWKLILKKLENLKEMEKFLDIYDLTKLNQEDINTLSKSITSNVLTQK
jgi:hypothetical protein